jgi:15-cis-phytoene synthase
MVGPDFLDADLREAERLAILYAPSRLRSRYRSLLTLDAVLMRNALAGREPGLAQIRLAWWREACAAPSANSGSPVIVQLAADWCRDAALLVDLVDAWEEVAAPDGDDLLPSCEAVAKARGAAFAACAIVPLDEEVRTAARRWTLAALSLQMNDDGQKRRLAAAAGQIRRAGLPRSLRPLAVLDGLAFRAVRLGHETLLGDRLSPLAALRVGFFGR